MIVSTEQFTPLPSQLGELSELRVLSFFENQLEGTISSEYGRLTSLRWHFVDLQNDSADYLSPNELLLYDAI